MHQENLSTPLIVDASSSVIQVGIANTSGWEEVASSESPALNGVFETVSKLIKNSNLKFTEIDAIFFCAGPGSTLGLRLTLAFIKTLKWEVGKKLKLFSYNALDLAACMSSKKDFFIQAPFRMGWRIVRIERSDSPIGKKIILETKDALKDYPKSIHLKDQRKNAKDINLNQFLDYDIRSVKGLKDLLPISEEKDGLEVYNPKPPSFKKWRPNIGFLKP